jgi:hypothetical protein
MKIRKIVKTKTKTKTKQKSRTTVSGVFIETNVLKKKKKSCFKTVNRIEING